MLRGILQAGIGHVVSSVHKMGKNWGERLTEKAVWHVVREYAVKAGIDKLALHDHGEPAHGSATLRENGPNPVRREPIDSAKVKRTFGKGHIPGNGAIVVAVVLMRQPAAISAMVSVLDPPVID